MIAQDRGTKVCSEKKLMRGSLSVLTRDHTTSHNFDCTEYNTSIGNTGILGVPKGQCFMFLKVYKPVRLLETTFLLETVLIGGKNMVTRKLL